MRKLPMNHRASARRTTHVPAIRGVVMGILALPLVVLALASPASAQEDDQGPAIVRTSYWQVNYADLDMWNEAFETHVAPVLDAMREEGAIQGYSTWEHNTGGGPYNYRLAIRFFEGANVTATVQDYVERVTESAGAETINEILRLSEKHEDQIWSVHDAWFREGGEETKLPHFYVADFQVHPADLEAWNAFYDEVWRPALISAAEAGNLNGFVVLEHVHGGPYNWKIMLFAPGWDTLDDVWNTSFEAFGQHGERWEEILGMIQDHDDVIWVPAGTGS